jgi:two-component system, chemotaxis family, chemotaxis protein CheY
MKLLIADDDFTSRMLLQKIISPYGISHVVIDGNEAVQGFSNGMEKTGPVI